MASLSQRQSDAIVNFVDAGTYPEDDSDVFAATVEPSTISSVRQSLRHAQQDAEEKIRAISREVAPDVDGWIAKAKQLQADIEHSRVVARDIVEKAGNVKKLQEEQADAAKKVDLLEAETAFHGDLLKILHDIKISRDLLTGARKAVTDGNTYEAFLTLRQIEEGLPALETLGKTSALDLFHQRVEDLREGITLQARDLMKKAFHTDHYDGRFSIQESISSSDGKSVRLSEAIELCSSLGLLDSEILRVKRDVESTLVAPILAHGTPLGVSRMVATDGGSLEVLQSIDTALSYDLFQDLTEVVSYIHQKMPPEASRLLAESLMPSIIAHLISHKLPASLPVSVEELKIVPGIVDSIKTFAEKLEAISWGGAVDLKEWVENLFKVWLSKKREKSVDVVRISLSKSLNERKTAEHVETQVVSSADAIAQTKQAEEWDEDWGDDDEQLEPPVKDEADAPTREEDWGAWDADDADTGGEADATLGSSRTNGAPAREKQEDSEEQEADDWGWDEQKTASVPASPKKPPKPASRSNGHAATPKRTEQELTLRETYTITSLPDELYASISTLITDAQILREESHATSPFAPAAQGLYSIPATTLSAYRALGPSYYELLPAGHMLLYNDSMRLSAHLKSLQSSLSSSDPGSSRLKLPTEIPTLEAFARRAYSKAMDEQRTVLRDFIDNAQGFANCTTPPYKQECDNAVQMTIAHVRAIAAQWSDVLSRSAWLQSLGSLVSTVIGKIILDVEEMSDIAASESTQLKEYFNSIAQLSHLFIQEDPHGGPREVVGVYVGQWFKFQYLAEILESNLEDMKFLWREGGLATEFDADEVVELMVALFAEGDRRRRAIAEIRRS